MNCLTRSLDLLHENGVDDRHADYPLNAHPAPLKMIVVSAWILAIGATLWAVKRAIWRRT